jgi:MerR family transcriptional regulator, redox-sensitive transcriptional activator SoxR
VNFPVEEPTLTIGEVARQAGMNTSAIRYYERVGVLPKPERLQRQRRYTAETVRQLQVIDLGKRAGFTLDQIKELLRSDHPREVLNRMAERKLPAVQELAEQAAALQGSATDHTRSGPSDPCSLFARSIERLAAPAAAGTRRS